MDKIILKAADYAAAVTMGSGTVLGVSLLLDDEWNMALGAAAGMAIGLLVMAFVFILFMRITTAFHLFPVGMPVTMITGMASGMATASGRVSAGVLYAAAVGFSVLTQLAVDLTDAGLRGDVPVEK
jgi:hypothetical protein